MISFLFGAVAGGFAVAYWYRKLNKLRQRSAPRWQDQAGDRLQAALRALVRIIENVSTKTRAGLRSEPIRKSESNMAG